MTSKLLILIIGVVCALLQVTGISIKERKQCCDLGTNFANTGNDCKNFKAEWAGPRLRTEKVCISTVDVCCQKQIREKECQLGIIDASHGATCPEDNGERKDCCEACQTGIDAAKAKESCIGLDLGAPFDEAFNQCCQEHSKITPSTTTTTTTSTTTIKTPVDNNYGPDNEPIENLCDSDVCAQICEPTGNSFKCDCYPGYVLMEDRISCRPEKRILKKGGRCEINNPCDHDCIDTGTAIKCSCRDGYKLSEDNRTCKDIDECALDLHDCNSVDDCINEIGAYSCYDPILDNETIDYENKCPPGFKFNFESLVCDDIDECQFELICTPPRVCKNSIGSFECTENAPHCPPGFHYKAAIDSCADIDECITGENDCNKESQFCLNTKGNYTCVDKASRTTCPPGFKMNTLTKFCDDINECEEDQYLCAENEECINEPGGHTCVPQENYSRSSSKPIQASTTSTTQATTTQKVICSKGYAYADELHSCTDVNECQMGLHDCKVAERCDNTIGSYHCSRIYGCGTGYTLNSANGLCEDDDECILGSHNCRELGPNFRCRNTLGSYRCEIISPNSLNPNDRRKPVIPYQPTSSTPIDNVPSMPSTTQSTTSKTTLRNKAAAYTTKHSGETVYEPPFVSSKYYTVGTFPVSPPTDRLSNVNPQDPRVVAGTILPMGKSAPNQTRISGTILPIGKFTTQSTLNTTPRTYRPYSTPIINTATTPDGTLPYYSPKPTTPSTTTTTTVNYGYPDWHTPENPHYSVISGQLKNCLPGYRMNYRGQCEDIDECENHPCQRFEKCVNRKGYYECIPPFQCKIGYEPNESMDACIDVNECSRGLHKCLSTQICKNFNGYYTCECPPGHHLDRATNQCEDLDECKMYRPCRLSSSTCVNLKGSFRCDCNEGFRRISQNDCEDIDECQTTGLCEHNCVNIWGSYRCSCNQGFTLNVDNRTCTDIDECERFKDRKLCIGQCKNVPGSYVCECPPGYKLGSDRRVCVDIDECQQSTCMSDEVCLNTKGGYKCYRIICPPNYIKDVEHKSRCKRVQSFCDPRDYQCLVTPDQYSYQYITFVSNLPLTHGHIKLFTITGPKWYSSRAEFTLKVIDVICPYKINQVDDSYFKKVNDQFNSMGLYLVRPIEGPQEIKLQIEMRLFQGNVITGTSVVYIIIVVSEFPF